MLSGKRKPQAEEIPKIIEFFEGSQSLPSDQAHQEYLEIWSQLGEQERENLLSVARAFYAQAQAQQPDSDEKDE